MRPGGVQPLGPVQLSVTPWTAAHQASPLNRIARLWLLRSVKKRGGIRANLRVTVEMTLPPSEAEWGLGLHWILWAGGRVPSGAGRLRAWS